MPALGNAKPPPSPPPPLSPRNNNATANNAAGIHPRHARGVSWDLVNNNNNNDDGVSAVTTPPAIVSLKDITGVTPMESEAETLLLSALEQSQPGDVPVETNALNNLTKQEESLFSTTSSSNTNNNNNNKNNRELASNTLQPQRILPKTSEKSLFSTAATKDTTKHLWDLAKHMKQQQQQQQYYNDNDDKPPLASLSSLGQSDLLAVHAAKLLARQRKTSSTLDSDNNNDNKDDKGQPTIRTSTSGSGSGSGGATTTTTNNANKWGKLRAAVQMNIVATHQVASQKKKNDDNDEQNDNNNDDDDKEEEEEEAATSNNEHDVELGNNQVLHHHHHHHQEKESSSGGSSSSSSSPGNGVRKSKMERSKEKGINAEFQAFRQWVSFKKTTLLGYIRKALLFAILPATGIAALLFYVGENPPCGTQTDCLRAKIRAENLGDIVGDSSSTSTSTSSSTNTTNAGEGVLETIFGPRGVRYDSPSVSWWILFIGVRQVITLSLAKLLQAFIIDFWVLRVKSASRLLGPYLSLMIVQAKGWPMQLILWGLLDIGMLYGDRPFARHWLFWQDKISLFNDTNPGGNVTESNQYKALLSLMCAIGGLVAFKRFFVGLRLGQKTYQRYGADLAKIMKKTILVSEVAALASDINKYELRTEDFGLHTEIYNDNQDEEGSSKQPSSRRLSAAPSGKSMSNLTSIAGMATEHKIRIAELLGEWEEPELAKHDDDDSADIGAVIQFRKSLSYLDTQFPFSVTFGPASTREACVRSAETVYKHLKMATPKSQSVVFDTLALSSIERDGTLDDHKLREMIKVFRPDRQGNLTLLDFCKSVDTVYKELRLFRASVANAARVDRSVERIINAVFYFVVGCVALAILGIDPFALFAAISGFILGFAFMIGAACSKYFEGLLMILISKPYDIGDKIQVAPVTSDSSASGSAYWLVKDVGLYHTTYMFWTQETAVCSNGALANTRIINATRSPQAILISTFKFPIDTPYHKIEVFKSTIEKFVKNRPREWLCFLAFRPTRVEADGGFVEYVFLAQHRENWANVGALKDSLADVSYFALEISKRLDMRYSAPPMPINLNMIGNSSSGGGASQPSLQQQMAAQLSGQANRLDAPPPQQPVLSSTAPGFGSTSNIALPSTSSRATHSPHANEEYNFEDIEAMFQHHKSN